MTRSEGLQALSKGVRQLDRGEFLRTQPLGEFGDARKENVVAGDRHSLWLEVDSRFGRHGEADGRDALRVLFELLAGKLGRVAGFRLGICNDRDSGAGRKNPRNCPSRDLHIYNVDLVY